MRLPANIPAHCRVQMVLKPTSDSLINMELWLPTQDWNGKFMGVGNGGFAGSIQGLTNEMPQALRLGYATAGTDTGHQDPGGDWAIGHPEKMIDFGYRATHVMTLTAKQIVKTFYDQNAKYSYFKGCSTGGRMALMEAQRYPDDYNGIIAGSLANRHIHMWTAGVARSIELSRHPEGSLTPEKAALVNQMVTSSCDTLKEGFLNNPRQCNVDFSKLLCAAGHGRRQLSDGRAIENRQYVLRRREELERRIDLFRTGAWQSDRRAARARISRRAAPSTSSASRSTIRISTGRSSTSTGTCRSSTRRSATSTR